MNLDLSQMEEGERKDEASPALVFFGNRSHTFSLRCKPKVHAELQTQKCSPEKFLIDNYNSGTGTYLLHLPTWLHTDEKLSEKSYFSEGVPNTRRDFLIETPRLVFCTSNSQTFSIIKESVGYWKTVVFSQFFFQCYQAYLKSNLCNLMPHGPKLNFPELNKCSALELRRLLY